MKLNLPLYSTSDGQKQRVASARARASKLATELIKSIPTVDTKELEIVFDSILSSGSIPSLKAASEIANTPDPNPYKEDMEKTVNRSGYCIVNGNNIFKLDENSNIESVRMLYIAGYSIKEIRTILSEMTPSSTFVAKVGKSVASFSLPQKEILHNTSYRFYSEYFSTTDGVSYIVYDTKNGSYGYFALVCEQDDNNKAYFKCTPKEFPIVGTLEMVIDGNKYSVDLNADIGKELEVQIKVAGLPITVAYENGLAFTCDKPFYFIASDTAFKLGIKDELKVAQKQIKEGYTGYSLISEGVYPYNCQVKKPVSSSSNSRVIYKNLIKQGFPEEYARKYINGESLYENLDEDFDSIRKTLDDDSLTRIKLDSLYRKTNIRIETISYQAIKRLLELSDADLEYLLRYREDILGINPYISKEECAEGITGTFNSNIIYSNSEVLECQVWKNIQASVRYIEVLSYDYSKKKEVSREGSEMSAEAKTARMKLNNFLDSIDEALFSKTELYSSSSYYSETSLGMDFVSSANLSAVYSIAGGVQCTANASAYLSLTAYNEFRADCMVIEGYLNAAFEVFNSVINKIKAVIALINSSLTVFSGSGTASLGVDSILQCSVSIDLALIVPPFLSKLSLLIVPIIAMLEAIVEMIINVERAMLCPAQNLLDKYINTRNFTLPCKVSLQAPLVSGVDAYLQGYLTALTGLKALCLTTKNDSNWLRKNVAMLPGSVDLMVTNSESCKES